VSSEPIVARPSIDSALSVLLSASDFHHSPPQAVVTAVEDTENNRRVVFEVPDAKWMKYILPKVRAAPSALDPPRRGKGFEANGTQPGCVAKSDVDIYTPAALEAGRRDSVGCGALTERRARHAGGVGLCGGGWV
jgi:hypothetical protein